MDESHRTEGDERDEQDGTGIWDRRTVLQTFAAGTTASAIGLGVVPSQAAADAIGTDPDRIDEARELRCGLSDDFIGGTGWPGHDHNDDEDQYGDKRGSYIKGLELANSLGEVDPSAYTSLLDALISGDPGDFASIHVGGDRQLVSPQSAHRFRFVGLDPHQTTMPPAPEFDSDVMAAEMAEVYWQALTRDVPFLHYGSSSADHPPVEAVDNINADFLQGYQGPTDSSGQVNLDLLFRMRLPGCLQGPYVSQFLWQPIPSGAFEHAQRIIEPEPEDYNTHYDEWLEMIEGTHRRGGEFPPTSQTYKTGDEKYIRNGRDLGEYAHVNFSYQPYLNAALILFFGYQAPLHGAAPHTGTGTQDPYLTFGGFSLTEVMATMAGLSIVAAWFHKWLVHRRLRPETYAGRVHNQFFGNKNYGLPQYFVQSETVERVVDFNADHYGNETALLPLAYAEGSPAHPSYPSGHATIAGACVTALKAFFDESHTLTGSVQAEPDGTALTPISFQPTVMEELNKLAANVSMGRDFAGVHYRSDALAGLRLGEQVAHRGLEYMLYGANEGHVPLEYHDFGGNLRHLY